MNQEAGKNIYDFCGKIFPYCRSITGEGVRKTLSEIDSYVKYTGGGGTTNIFCSFGYTGF